MPRDPLVGMPLIRRTLTAAGTHRQRSVVVVPSEFMRRLILLEGFPPTQVHCVPPFTELPPAADLGPPSDPYTVFCAARLTPEKGIHLVLEAIRDLPVVKLIVAGAGPERHRLESLAGQYGLSGRVAFTGWLEPQLVGTHMARAGVVVVPSIWPEPFGITGIEAMAYARPVVAFDVGGIRDWLTPEQTGLLVPPGDVGALRAALLRLLRNPGLAARLGYQGRAEAEQKFTPRAFLSSFVPLVAATVARSQSPATPTSVK